MNEASGYGIVQVGSEALTVKFGLNAYKLFTQYRGVKLSELGELISEGSHLDKTASIIEMTYFAYVTDRRIKGMEPSMNITQFVEMVNDGDTTAFLNQVNIIMEEARLLGKTINQWEDGKKKQ